MTELVTALANLFIAIIVIGYVRHSVRSRAAVGLWWDFLRDKEPIRFWLYIGVVAVIAVVQFVASVSSLVLIASGQT